jgi:hypothetical protein
VNTWGLPGRAKKYKVTEICLLRMKKDDRKLCLGDELFFISMEVYEKRESLEIWRSPRGTEGSKSRGTKAIY